MRMLAGQYDEAKEDCAAAIRLAPKDSYPFYTLALVHYNFGNYQQARIECLKAISRATYEPDYLQLYITLAKLRLRSYDDARAIRELQEYWDSIDRSIWPAMMQNDRPMARMPTKVVW